MSPSIIGALRRLLPIILTVLILGTACSASSTSGTDVAAAAAPNPSASQSDDEWPYQFTVAALDGSVIDTGDYAGQDLVLWFWAPW